MVYKYKTNGNTLCRDYLFRFKTKESAAAGSAAAAAGSARTAGSADC